MELSESDNQEVRATFDLFDEKQTGRVEVGRIATMIRAMGDTPTESKLNTVVKTASSKGDYVTFEDVLSIVSDLRNDSSNGGYKSRISEADVRAAFKVFDGKGRGYVTEKELRHVLTSFGDKLSEQEAEQLIAVADVDGNGLIDYVRFANKLVN